MSSRRYWPGSWPPVLDWSPRPRVDLAAEVQRLADQAVHGDELAAVLAIARSPLPDIDDGEPPERDEALEDALAAQVESDAALRASAADTLAAPPVRARPVTASGRARRKRGVRVNLRERRITDLHTGRALPWSVVASLVDAAQSRGLAVTAAGGAEARATTSQVRERGSVHRRTIEVVTHAPSKSSASGPTGCGSGSSRGRAAPSPSHGTRT